MQRADQAMLCLRWIDRFSQGQDLACRWPSLETDTHRSDSVTLISCVCVCDFRRALQKAWAFQSGACWCYLLIPTREFKWSQCFLRSPRVLFLRVQLSPFLPESERLHHRDWQGGTGVLLNDKAARTQCLSVREICPPETESSDLLRESTNY